MSACFISHALFLPHNADPNWERVPAAIDALPDAEVRAWLTENGFDVPVPALFAEGSAVSDLRDEVRSTFAELRKELTEGTEFDTYSLRGLDMYVTGGMSHGDSPTDLALYMAQAWGLPSVLAAANFVVDNDVLAGRKDA